ncbi:unnamed protein product [Symbiodinium sp. CCMP2456]|nr:unnamed protein product [Symbiodinium sp. CCMP2456]
MGGSCQELFKCARSCLPALCIAYLAGGLQGCIQNTSDPSEDWMESETTKSAEGSFLGATSTSQAAADPTAAITTLGFIQPAKTTTLTLTTTTTSVVSAWSFAGITSAVSFRVSEVDVSWPAVLSSGSHQRFEYFLAYAHKPTNLTVEDVLNASDDSDSDDSDDSDEGGTDSVIVLRLGDQLNASLKNMTPNTTVSLLAVAAAFGHDEMSTDQLTIHVLVAGIDSIRAEGTRIVPVEAGDELEVEANASSISLLATDKAALPDVSHGSCLTGTDSSGESFFVIAENITVRGLMLVADTRPAAITDVYKQLQLDTTVSLPSEGSEGRRLEDLQKTRFWSMLKAVHLDFGAGLNLEGELRANAQVRVSLSIIFPGIISSILITTDFDWSLRSSLEFNRMTNVLSKEASASVPMPKLPPIPTPIPGVWIQLAPSLLQFWCHCYCSDDISIDR